MSDLRATGGPRTSNADLNPAAREFSEEDHKNGTVKAHADALHALTLQAAGNEAEHPHSEGTLALTPAGFGFNQLTKDRDAGRLIPPWLSHWDQRALDTTSKGASLLVRANPAFSLTRQALTVGTLRLTKTLMDALRRHNAALEAFTPPDLFDISDTDEFLQAFEQVQERIASDTQGAAHQSSADQIQAQLKAGDHISAAREGEIRGILNARGAHLHHQILLQKCDAFLRQFDGGQFACVDPAQVVDVAQILHSPQLKELGAILTQHKLGPDPACSADLRGRLVELRQQVLASAAGAIVQGHPIEEPPASQASSSPP